MAGARVGAGQVADGGAIATGFGAVRQLEVQRPSSIHWKKKVRLDPEGAKDADGANFRSNYLPGRGSKEIPEISRTPNWTFWTLTYLARIEPPRQLKVMLAFEVRFAASGSPPSTYQHLWLVVKMEP